MTRIIKLPNPEVVASAAACLFLIISCFVFILMLFPLYANKLGISLELLEVSYLGK